MKGEHIDAFTRDFSRVVQVSLADVIQLPSACAPDRYVLCAKFDAQNPTASCPMGPRCRYVHSNVNAFYANPTPAAEAEIHVNYAWPSLEAVTYPRHTHHNSELVPVANPNSKDVFEHIPATALLQTRALGLSRRPLAHCAHYRLNRVCRLGPKCQFVHAVYIKADAAPYERAPLIRSEGRPSLPQPSALQPSQEANADTANALRYNSHPIQLDSFANWYSSRSTPTAATSEAPAEDLTSCRKCSASCRHHSHCGCLRRQHEPYQASGFKLICSEAHCSC